MTLRKALLWLIFIDFAVFSGWVMWQVGYMGVWAAGFTDPGSMQLLFDLVICCLLISSWLKQDARQWEMNPYPWMVAIFITGSIAILVYLLIREYRKEGAPQGLRQTAGAMSS